MEEALILKEESACRLVAELENMKAQFQELIQEHAKSIEEQQLLINQNKALASNLGEREVGKEQLYVFNAGIPCAGVLL